MPIEKEDETVVLTKNPPRHLDPDDNANVNSKSKKKHGRVRRVLLTLLAALLACAVIASGFSLVSNRFGTSYDDLGETERAVLDQYGKLYDAVEKDGETLWADDPVTKRPVAAIGRSGSYANLLINPTTTPNPLTSVRISMPKDSPLTVYRVASADPGVLKKRFDAGDFGLSTLAGNDVFYVRIGKSSTDKQDRTGRFIYLLTHESLHIYVQGNWPEGSQFVEGLRRQDMDLVYGQMDQLDIMQQQVGSGHPDEQTLRNALHEFVSLADQLKQTSPKYAKLSETKYTDEGTADYVGFKADQLAAGIKPYVFDDNGEEVRFSQVKAWYKEGKFGHDFLMGRNYPYGVGALLCQVFDRLDVTGWQEKLNKQTLSHPVTVVDIARDVVGE